jgi:hypothetical protein
MDDNADDRTYVVIHMPYFFCTFCFCIHSIRLMWHSTPKRCVKTPNDFLHLFLQIAHFGARNELVFVF